MKSIFKYRRSKELLLRADREVPYGFVIKVISGVKRAGIDKLGMVTEPIE
jgi:biopolymer transport protein TolR